MLHVCSVQSYTDVYLTPHVLRGHSLYVHLYFPRENYVRKLIQQYFVQLTKGCGHNACSNSNCANGNGHPMNPTDAAAKALALATSHTKGESKLCSTDMKSLPRDTRVAQTSKSSAYSSQVSGDSTHLQKLSDTFAVKAKRKKTVTVSITDELPTSDQITR